MTVAAPTVHEYRPRGACAEVFSRRDPEVLIAGPAGTGKSRSCMEKIHAMALANPGMRALLVRKTLTSLSSSGLVTWETFVVPEAVEMKAVEFFGGNAKEPAAYRYRNGSRVVVGGMDRPSKIMSTEYDAAYAQEATELTVADWEAITTRLRNGKVSFQQLIADCNPDAPTHWLHQRCEAGGTLMLHSRHQDNPVYYDDDGELTPRGAAYIANLDRLTGVRHKRLRLGLWVAAEGQIYDEWDPAVHLVDPFEPPDDWPRWWAVDFGYTNPFVWQDWAEDPDGRLFLVREIYRTQRIVEDHASQILDLVAPGGTWREPRPAGIVCDHDAEGRATLERKLGLSTRPANKAVSSGIQATQARMKAAGDGRPRLFAMRDATVERDQSLVEAGRPASTVEEVAGYVWDNQPGKPPKETPVKADDHGMDAMRYLVMQLDGGRWEDVELHGDVPTPGPSGLAGARMGRVRR